MPTCLSHPTCSGNVARKHQRKPLQGAQRKIEPLLTAVALVHFRYPSRVRVSLLTGSESPLIASGNREFEDCVEISITFLT